MRRTLRAGVTVLALATALASTPATGSALAYKETDSPPGAVMAADVVVIRPVGLAATVIGSGLFMVSLPFAALGSNTGEVAQRLVVEPAAFTFSRPLGHFQYPRENPARMR